MQRRSEKSKRHTRTRNRSEDKTLSDWSETVNARIRDLTPSDGGREAWCGVAFAGLSYFVWERSPRSRCSYGFRYRFRFWFSFSSLPFPFPFPCPSPWPCPCRWMPKPNATAIACFWQSFCKHVEAIKTIMCALSPPASPSPFCETKCFFGIPPLTLLPLPLSAGHFLFFCFVFWIVLWCMFCFWKMAVASLLLCFWVFVLRPLHLALSLSGLVAPSLSVCHKDLCVAIYTETKSVCWGGGIIKKCGWMFARRLDWVEVAFVGTV